MLKHEVMAADEWHDHGPQELAFKLPSIKCNCLLPAYTITPPTPWGTMFTTLTANRSPTQRHLPTEVSYNTELQSGQDHSICID
jgi:hypothetical protein